MRIAFAPTQLQATDTQVARVLELLSEASVILLTGEIGDERLLTLSRSREIPIEIFPFMNRERLLPAELMAGAEIHPPSPRKAELMLKSAHLLVVLNKPNIYINNWRTYDFLKTAHRINLPVEIILP